MATSFHPGYTLDALGCALCGIAVSPAAHSLAQPSFWLHLRRRSGYVFAAALAWPF